MFHILLASPLVHRPALPLTPSPLLHSLRGPPAWPPTPKSHALSHPATGMRVSRVTPSFLPTRRTWLCSRPAQTSPSIAFRQATCSPNMGNGVAATCSVLFCSCFAPLLFTSW